MVKPFQFKQFTVKQDRCAMKIGTDGVLLGAWTSLKNKPNSILDIGAGTGVIALQMAQRSQAQLIDAVEIDDDAYEQCVENFENAPWNDRLFCYHASLIEFAQEWDEASYDLIVSNPPFYSDTYKPENQARKTARFQEALSFSHLLYSVAKLLDKKGSFSTIIPYAEEEKFIQIASSYQLYINRKCHVKGNPKSPVKRSLLQFSFQGKIPETERLTIEIERHKYTDEYKKLVADFYLKM